MFRSKITERNYIERLIAKDERALEYVIEHYSGLLYSIIRKNLAMLPDKIDECFDDVLLKIWDHADCYDPQISSFKGWISAIARYLTINYLKKAKRETKGFTKEYLEQNVIEPGKLDENLLYIEETLDDETENILSCLSPVDKELFRRLIIEDEDIEDVSKDLDMSKNVIYNRVSRGKKKIRKIFDIKEARYESEAI